MYLNLLLSPEKKKTTWRLNNNLLKGTMKEELKIEIQPYLDDNDNGEVSPLVLWDACKAVLRGKIIAKTAYIKKQRQWTLKALQLDLQKLEQENKQKPNKNITQEIKKKKAEINLVYSEEIQKKILFAKQRYYEVGNKSTKLLAYKLRKHQAKNNIYGIRDPKNKKIKYKTEDIQKCFEIYYTTLYAQSIRDDDDQIK